LGGIITGFLYLRWYGPNLDGGSGGNRKRSRDDVRRRLSLVVNNEEDEKKIGDKGMPITWN
jgi:hypothetical protein